MLAKCWPCWAEFCQDLANFDHAIPYAEGALALPPPRHSARPVATPQATRMHARDFPCTGEAMCYGGVGGCDDAGGVCQKDGQRLRRAPAKLPDIMPQSVCLVRALMVCGPRVEESQELHEYLPDVSA